jgi:hypothetical protein
MTNVPRERRPWPPLLMRRATFLAAATAVTAIVCAAGTEPARSASMLCVGAKTGCFATIQAALDVAEDGDTIAIGPGRFAGGIMVLKSVQLVGAGVGATTIEGGGPVLTIGEVEGVDQPTVSISRVTITGGFNDSAPESFAASGGGVWIPPGSGNTTGATVSISDSVITGNRAAPETAVPLCGHVCGFAAGAGINNAGTLTVTNTTITDNVAGSTASDPSVASFVAGGGIMNGPQGSLTLLHSFVTGNRAAVSPPNGRNTDGGGIVSYGVLTVEDSVIGGNRSDVEAAVPSSFFSGVFTEANAGGLYLAPSSSTTITRSTISGNGAHSSNTAGDASAEAGGIDAEGSLLLTDSSVQNNTALASVPAGSGFLAETDGGGIQVRGSAAVRDSRITNNGLSSTSESGLALASGGGFAIIGGSLTLERTVVAANSAGATGVGGFNLGGGILNILFGGGPPELTLTDTVVTANRLAASDGVMSQGGGLYTADPFTGVPFPVAMIRTVIEGNKPDQCVGC